MSVQSSHVIRIYFDLDTSVLLCSSLIDVAFTIYTKYFHHILKTNNWPTIDLSLAQVNVKSTHLLFLASLGSLIEMHFRPKNRRL